MKDIIVVTEHFYPEMGATSQLVTDLVDRLVIDKNFVRVLTASPSSSHSSHIVRLSSLPSSKSIRVETKLLKGVIFVYSVICWILSNRPHKHSCLLVVSNPPFVGLVGLVSKLLFNVPYVFLLQDVFPRSAVLSGILPARGPLTYAWTLLIKIVIKSSTSTIVLSDSMRSRVASEFDCEHKLSVISNWSVLNYSVPSSSVQPETSSQSTSQLNVQYSGNLGRLHDIITILEAARITLESQANIHYTFIGSGAKHAQVIAYKDRLHLHNISIKPYQPREKAFASISSCDVSIISIIPGAQDTIAPCKLYGILSAAKPVVLIARPNCYIADYIRDYHIGHLVEPGEPQELARLLSYLSTRPEELRIMGDNALSLYNSHFTFYTAYKRYLSLL